MGLMKRPGFRAIVLSLVLVLAIINPRPLKAGDLDDNEEEILSRGEITSNQRLMGALLSIVPGFGMGQAVEGRFAERGWIFTVGEAASLGLAYASGPNCLFNTDTPHGSCSTSTVFFVIAALLKVWEVGDAVIAPISINHEYERLHWRQQGVYSGFNILPAPIGSQNAPGVALNWQF